MFPNLRQLVAKRASPFSCLSKKRDEKKDTLRPGPADPGASDEAPGLKSEGRLTEGRFAATSLLLRPVRPSLVRQDAKGSGLRSALTRINAPASLLVSACQLSTRPFLFGNRLARAEPPPIGILWPLCVRPGVRVAL